jgi:hypothetical protein
MPRICVDIEQEAGGDRIAACVQPTLVEVVRCDLDVLYSSVGLVASQEPFKVSQIAQNPGRK